MGWAYQEPDADTVGRTSETEFPSYKSVVSALSASCFRYDRGGNLSGEVPDSNARRPPHCDGIRILRVRGFRAQLDLTTKR